MSRDMRSAASSIGGGPGAGAPDNAQLREEIADLERLVKKQRDFYMLLERQQIDAGIRDDYAKSACPEEEYERLVERNAFLRADLERCLAAEKKYANDPRVLDKRNEVVVVRRKIAEVEKAIMTLQTVKQRRDKGLRAISRTQSKAQAARGQQENWNAGLREEVKVLSDRLRILEKEDVALHERVAYVQDQIKCGMTQKAFDALEADVHEQQRTLSELRQTEAEWRAKKLTDRSHTQRRITKEHKECKKLERQLSNLRLFLREKQTEVERGDAFVARLHVDSSLSTPRE